MFDCVPQTTRAWRCLLMVLAMLFTPGAALAATTVATPDYSAIGALLLAFFGVVVLFESGFGLLFQWRLFREFLPVSGWRTPIMFVVSALLTYNFDALDVFHRSLEAFAGVATGPRHGTWLISAAILAGGSAGMMRIFEQLGVRAPSIEPPPPAIDKSKAWISLQVASQGRDPSTVVLNIHEAIATETLAVHAGIAGTLRDEGYGTRLKRIMLRDLRRFPPSGGYLVEANKPYVIALRYPQHVEIGGNQKFAVCDIFGREVLSTEAVEPVSFAPRAIVDLIVDLPS